MHDLSFASDIRTHMLLTALVIIGHVLLLSTVWKRKLIGAKVDEIFSGKASTKCLFLTNGCLVPRSTVIIYVYIFPSLVAMASKVFEC